MDGLLAGSTRVSLSGIDEITIYVKGLEYLFQVLIILIGCRTGADT